jgi:membrane protein DedA with SNARE-associated domain
MRKGGTTAPRILFWFRGESLIRKRDGGTIVAVVEKHEQFWRRHVGALVAGGFALLLVVIVAGQLFEKGHVADWLADAPEQWAYVLCGLFVWFDAVIPIFPGETTLSAASTLAARGDLNLQVVMVAGALGAILGDSSLFWIARKSAAKMKTQRDKALENPKVRAVWDALDRSPGLLIVAGRYVPGMRFAVNASMGISDIPYRRFLPWSVLGGALWSELSGPYTRAHSPTGWQRRSPATRSLRS